LIGASKDTDPEDTIGNVGDDYPIYYVSWDEAVAFCRKLTEQERSAGRLPAGYEYRLPTEAEWEYACRAGTTEATYAGKMEIKGKFNAPVLDAIAWYGGNSGVGFELKNGADSSGWSEKQYPHERAGTRAVAAKAANRWGLHDMLGNVWEWCADHWHDGYRGAPDDDSAWVDAGVDAGAASRVFRGGSWFADARYVRAACRNHAHPADRGDSLGFRCARVQA